MRIKLSNFLFLAVFGLCFYCFGSESSLTSVNGEIYLSGVNNYLFRGFNLTPTLNSGEKASFVLQPGFSLYNNRFFLGIWNSMSEGGHFDEFDITASYKGVLSEKIYIEGGFTIYNYPETVSTFEYFCRSSVDIFLSPSLSLYYDFVLDSLYLEMKGVHSLSFKSFSWFSLVFGLSAGYSISSPDMLLSVLGLSLTESFEIGSLGLSMTEFVQLPLSKVYKLDYYLACGTVFKF